MKVGVKVQPKQEGGCRNHSLQGAEGPPHLLRRPMESTGLASRGTHIGTACTLLSLPGNTVYCATSICTAQDSPHSQLLFNFIASCYFCTLSKL